MNVGIFEIYVCDWLSCSNNDLPALRIVIVKRCKVTEQVGVPLLSLGLFTLPYFSILILMLNFKCIIIYFKFGLELLRERRKLTDSSPLPYW
jgi:hypothetical protein